MKLILIVIALITLTGCNELIINKSHTSEMINGAMTKCESQSFDVSSTVKNNGTSYESTFDLSCGGVK